MGSLAKRLERLERRAGMCDQRMVVVWEEYNGPHVGMFRVENDGPWLTEAELATHDFSDGKPGDVSVLVVSYSKGVKEAAKQLQHEQ